MSQLIMQAWDSHVMLLSKLDIYATLIRYCHHAGQHLALVHMALGSLVHFLKNNRLPLSNQQSNDTALAA